VHVSGAIGFAIIGLGVLYMLGCIVVGPRFRLLFGEPGGLLLGLNLFAAWLIYLLWKSREGRD